MIEFDKINDIDAFIKVLEELPEVEYAERVPIRKSTYNPNDPYADNNYQWYLSQINAYTAWNIHQEGDEVVVAIVDDAG